MTVFDLLRRGAAISPDRIAVTHAEREITYRDLIERSARLGDYLQRCDFPSGSRVAILYENSIEYVVAFFAVFSAGYVAVPLDTSHKPDQVRFILKDCGASALILQGKFSRTMPSIIGEKSPLELIISDADLNSLSPGIRTETLASIFEKTDPTRNFAELTEGIHAVGPLENLNHRTLPECPRELAAIFYTSGSTGVPKGVMLSHLNLVSNTVATVEYLRLTADDAIMTILPFYYIYGNSLLLTHMLVGGRVVIDNRFAFPQVVLKTMREQRATGFSGVPSNFMILLNQSEFVAEKLPHLRYLTQAGGAMAPEVTRRVIEAMAGKEVFIMYGQTEASPRVTWLPPERLSEKMGSIGIPVPGVNVTVIDGDGKEVPNGKVGEIAVRGDCVMLGYWNHPGEQREVLRDGCLMTGDLARCDEDGFFFIVARKKEILKVGGKRVSAKEIEETILTDDRVLEVAVLGIEDDILGEAVKAVVVVKDGFMATAREIQEHCLLNLAPHKAPKVIEFVASLPKYQSGKVNKLALAGKNANGSELRRDADQNDS